jgi:hypothetical protein
MQATLQLSQKIEDRNIRNGQLGILTTARQGNSTCSNVGCVNVVVPWQFYADFQTLRPSYVQSHFAQELPCCGFVLLLVPMVLLP